jgi:hypoxanthine phosphoribosyltransferase
VLVGIVRFLKKGRIMPTIKPYLTETQLQTRIQEMGQKITEDYQGKDLLVVGLLNGSFMFTADLVRTIKTPLEVDFISLSSYGSGTTSSGQVKLELDLRRSIEGRHVLLVEDIVDTGHTMKFLKPFLLERQPASLKLVSLLFKPARLAHPTTIDYCGFEIEDHFVIGYGLDYDGKYRELPYIGLFEA